jgi:hypothetical protein
MDFISQLTLISLLQWLAKKKKDILNILIVLHRRQEIIKQCQLFNYLNDISYMKMIALMYNFVVHAVYIISYHIILRGMIKSSRPNILL